MIKKLSEESSREFLREHSTARLGCILDSGEPYVVPVVYLYRDDSIYIHSLEGLKISAMRKNPKICLQTDEVQEDGFEWKSVIVFGEFKEITEQSKKTEVLFDFYKKFPKFTPVEAKFDDEVSMKSVIIFRIEIERITGVTESY